MERQPLFQEIISPEMMKSVYDVLPDHIEAYISVVEPKICGRLVKELTNLLPLIKIEDYMKRSNTNPKNEVSENDSSSFSKWPILGHLKRVRRVKIINTQENGCNSDENDNEPPKKMKKTSKTSAELENDSIILEVLIGSVSHIDHILSMKKYELSSSSSSFDSSVFTKLTKIIDTYDLHLTKRILPGRPAQSNSELTEWNQRNWWPTSFFENQTIEFKQKELQISLDEQYSEMKEGILHAIHDGNIMNSDYNYSDGAIIYCPVTKKVISQSHKELGQQISHKSKNTAQSIDCDYERKKLLKLNPLCTPILLAIQGVSRLERGSAIGHGIDSENFKNGQYLCTGYDIYTTKEPNVFEAMALVHSRIRRVIFGFPNRVDGGLGGTSPDLSVHGLPGTNHHYRAFCCCENVWDNLVKEANKNLSSF